MDCIKTDNSIREYNKNGAIDTADTNAVTFVNTGTSIATLNGFPLQPGTALSFGNEAGQCDQTKYQLSFINTGTQTNQLFVFRGHSNIQLSQILAAVGGTHDNVNIFDSAGGTLTASGGKLTVLDTAVVSAINNLPTSGLSTAANQATEISILNALPTSGLATTANQISQISLESTLNGIVATKTNQNTEIALLTSLDTNVKSIRLNIAAQPVSSFYYFSATGDYALLSTLMGSITIGAGKIGVLSTGAAGGIYTGSEGTYYAVLFNTSSNGVISPITRNGLFIKTTAQYNAAFIYCAQTTINLNIFNISDLIL